MTSGGDSEEEESDSDQDDASKNLSGVLEKMKARVKQPTIMKMVTKPKTEKFHTYLVKFQEELIKAREDRGRTEVKVEEKSAIAKIVREELKEGAQKVEAPKRVAGYAEAVGRTVTKVPKVTGMKESALPAPKIVVVKHETKESEEVKATLKKLLRPSDIKHKVRRLINILNGMIVDPKNEEGAENLMSQKAPIDAGLKVERPEKKTPVIMIYDVSAILKVDEVKEAVFARNMSASEIEEEDFKKELQVRHRYKDMKSEGRKNHVVVECSVRVRNWLRRQEKIFVEWQCY